MQSGKHSGRLVRSLLTYSYFPLKERLKCSWMEVYHKSPQFLMRHGAFMEYLHRFSNSETDECKGFEALDSMEHVVFSCENILDTRKALRDLVELRGLHWRKDGDGELWNKLLGVMSAEPGDHLSLPRDE